MDYQKLLTMMKEMDQRVVQVEEQVSQLEDQIQEICPHAWDNLLPAVDKCLFRCTVCNQHIAFHDHATPIRGSIPARWECRDCGMQCDNPSKTVVSASDHRRELALVKTTAASRVEQTEKEKEKENDDLLGDDDASVASKLGIVIGKSTKHLVGVAKKKKKTGKGRRKTK